MTDTDTKRAEARLPRGLGDRGPDDIAATHRMLEAIRKTYELYGFEAVETPLIEFTDALGKFLPDLDRPNEGVFSFKDDDEQWLSLRYDLTAPLARYVAENFDKLPKPYRSYRAGLVFRNEKPGPGRFRQFMQFDADTVGSTSVAADAEMCMMAADTLEALGIQRGDYVIKVNNRKLLDGAMDSVEIPDERRLTVLRALDKYDRLGPNGVRALLGKQRIDESGDVTKGADLADGQIDHLMMLFEACPQAGANLEALPEWEQQDSAFVYREFNPDTISVSPIATPGSLPISNHETIRLLRGWFNGSGKEKEALDELEEIAGLLRAGKYGSKRVRIDPSVVRGLEYYTGPVFEAELTLEVKGDDGKPIRFGSVGGGGRYDGLVGRFRGEDVPATGFSIGVSRLFSALEKIGSPLVARKAHHGPVVVLVLDRDPESLKRYQKLVNALRTAKNPITGKPEPIPAELYLGQSGMNAQLKYADKRKAICAVIQGSNERDHADGPQVVVRDLVLGLELAKSTKDRADYIELRAKAQSAVAETDLVAKVREVLARHEG